MKSEAYSEIFSEVDLDNVPHKCYYCDYLQRPASSDAFKQALTSKNYAFRIKGPSDILLSYCRVALPSGTVEKEIYRPKDSCCTKWLEDIRIRRERVILRELSIKEQERIKQIKSEIAEAEQRRRDAKNEENRIKKKYRDMNLE